ncbi:hypothetical protein DERP_014794 [Dermatophagoides pteronyssinus]|uniref:Uncharacterized protein n=1 Tax=Dermatophagoides pteronyssinus TaxID=6956 RepID=A0ABQ8J2F1_DERPT|nr:hypothetical protein DERP_014794 [Dermatophagoides pteronyssinus]
MHCSQSKDIEKNNEFELIELNDDVVDQTNANNTNNLMFPFFLDEYHIEEQTFQIEKNSIGNRITHKICHHQQLTNKSYK